MLSPEVASALNTQLAHELETSIQYLVAAAYCERSGATEVAHLLYAGADRERDHALSLVGYLVDAGAPLAVPALPAPTAEFRSAGEAVHDALTRERAGGERLDRVRRLADAQGDAATVRFVDWLVAEQGDAVAALRTALTRTP